MKVNHNISAVIANNNLLVNENRLSNSLEKLSSGYKINSAKDSPTGIAISIRMRAQIEALNKVSDNASDGEAVIETADGVMNEITSMLQRMRELSVQAANGTNTQADTKAIQDEIDSLSVEIDRISKDTEYNSMTLFDGSMSRRVYSENGAIANVTQTIDVSGTVPSGKYQLTNITVGTKSQSECTYSGTAMNASLKINGVEISFSDTDTADEIWEKLQEGAAAAGLSVESSSLPLSGASSITFIANEFGSDSTINIEGDDNALAMFTLGQTTNGTNATATIQRYNEGTKTYEEFNASVTAHGSTLTASAQAGFSISLILDSDKINDGDTVDLDVTDIGTMRLQVGANEDQIIDMSIPEISCKTLGIDNLCVRNEAGAGRAMERLDDAINFVTSARAKLGAYQNRLEHTESSLDATSENMTDALSRITDVDMAEEMTNYTNLQVVTQAATSVLAQANELPEQALQLLK